MKEKQAELESVLDDLEQWLSILTTVWMSTNGREEGKDDLIQRHISLQETMNISFLSDTNGHVQL